MQYRLTIFHDPDTENPNDYNAVRVVSFNTRHVGYVHPDTLDDSDTIGLLSYSEHGRCQWSPTSSGMPPFIDHWDYRAVAGAVVLNPESGHDVEYVRGLNDTERAELVAAVAEEYTAWCNGDTYGWMIESVRTCDDCGHEVTEPIDGCGGYIVTDMDDFLDMVEWPEGVDREDVEVRETAC